jgi:serine protease Do
MTFRPLFAIIAAVAAVLVLTLPGAGHAKVLAPDFVELAERLKPSVVNISTSKTQKSFQHPSYPGMEQFDEFFGNFFGGMPSRPRQERSLGSGFIISDDGYILTNNHVVDGADEIVAKLSDGREFKGVIKGSDEKLDLALVKIDTTEKLPAVTLGDSDDLRVGEWVMAIGNPFGLAQTVTAGIISAKGRVIGSGPYDDFIQTDASINPGNSGGPLFNVKGEVIGINTAIIAGGQGIGFAIPVNMAKTIIPQLRDAGRVTRGWLGVSIQPMSKELAQAFGLEEDRGALVTDVTKESPAEKGGLKNGDIILEFDGRKIQLMHDLPRLVASTAVGKKVPVVVLRDAKRQELTVTVEKLREGGGKELSLVPEEKLGLAVQALTAELAAKLRLKEKEGVVVVEVKPGSPATKAGINRGDIIRELRGVKTGTMAEYEEALGGIRSGDSVKVLLRRGGSSLYVALKVP